jgi:hypothetical protein
MYLVTIGYDILMIYLPVICRSRKIAKSKCLVIYAIMTADWQAAHADTDIYTAAVTLHSYSITCMASTRWVIYSLMAPAVIAAYDI